MAAGSLAQAAPSAAVEHCACHDIDAGTFLLSNVIARTRERPSLGPSLGSPSPAGQPSQLDSKLANWVRFQFGFGHESQPSKFSQFPQVFCWKFEGNSKKEKWKNLAFSSSKIGKIGGPRFFFDF